MHCSSVMFKRPSMIAIKLSELDHVRVHEVGVILNLPSTACAKHVREDVIWPN